ncbi:MAG: hypothetical protein CM15mP95_3080 [Alphaproteobacteria bacterium]|nr:MAG: hypothetical protein CM15mP95_3080 [Alphaproteobacteria bacterium]
MNFTNGLEVGKRYTESNLHAQLIGPKGVLLSQKILCSVFFILGPWTLYKDHSHIAPEFYLNLSNKSDWRFNFGTMAEVRCRFIDLEPEQTDSCDKGL